MTKNTIFAFALVCIGLGQSAYAQPDSEKQRCSVSIVNLVGKHFGISDFSYPREGMYPSAQNGGVITAGVCKIWPKNNAITLAAFAYEDNLVVAMIDNVKGRVIASSKGNKIGIPNFGVAQDGLKLDTARYDLAPGIRAFGLDATEQYNPNCGDGGAGPERTLLIQEGKTIRPILNSFTLYTWSYVQGGNPRCGAGNEEVINEYVSYTLGIGQTTTNGYANLVITATLSYGTGEKPKLDPFQYELKYDGNMYQNIYGGAAFYKWLNDSRPDKWKN